MTFALNAPVPIPKSGKHGGKEMKKWVVLFQKEDGTEASFDYDTHEAAIKMAANIMEPGVGLPWIKLAHILELKSTRRKVEA